MAKAKNWVCNSGVESLSDLNPKEGDRVIDNAPDDWSLRFARILDICSARGFVLAFERNRDGSAHYIVRKPKARETVGECVGI